MIYFKELAYPVGLASLKSARQVGRLETHGGVDVAVLSQKAAWRQNSFFLGQPLFT